MSPLLLLVLSQVTFHQQGSAAVSVREIQCAADGGTFCTQANSRGSLFCAAASSTELGCVSTSSQTFAGAKTFTGNVKTPLIDAGIGAIGDLDFRASTITNNGTSSALTIQSNTADSTTSSSVAAMNFTLGANITNSDLAWCFKDSSGNKRLCGTEQGDWNFSSLITDTGAATAAGTTFTAVCGAGGASSGATPGGTGGALSWTAGAGGASAGSAAGGTGGAITLTAGAGGAENGVQNGGAGGAVTFTAGVGKAGSAGGGVMTLAAGAGSNATASVGSSPGGAFSIAGGAGGATISGTGSVGGAMSVVGGIGGAGASGTAGAGGALTLRSGAGGTNGVTGGASGDVALDTGAATGSATNGSITIGGTNANSITLGRSTKAITADGYGILGTHGTTRQSSEVGEGAMTAGVLAVTFSTAFAAKPVCVCTHVDTTNDNPCNIKTDATATTNGVSFRVTSGGTDIVDWICIGQR